MCLPVNLSTRRVSRSYFLSVICVYLPPSLSFPCLFSYDVLFCASLILTGDLLTRETKNKGQAGVCVLIIMMYAYPEQFLRPDMTALTSRWHCEQ